MLNKTNTLRWLARITGGLSVLFFGMFFIGEGIPDLQHGDGGDLQSVLLLLVFAIAGYLFAWFREKEGGLVMLFSGIIMGLTVYYSGGPKQIQGTLIYSLPFIIPALLFLLSVPGKNSSDV